ncbi:MAG: hypothetical protein NZ889_01830 [Candidatus Pacearchaeota archaeon]|nr:hypothetical protein [Candidatus Pacearchaeota archaeon]
MKDGFIILDKPACLTSFECCEKIKQILDAKKAGHAGTLDMNATGILIVGINKACKLMPLLERLDKTYEGTAHLHKEVPLEKLRELVKNFVGKIKQIPPRRSRVARKERERFVYRFEILKKKNKKVFFLVSCEAGTYIRKLIHDFGKLFGGAHMTSLRRIKQGPFLEKEAIKLEDVSEERILSCEEIIKRLKLPKIIVDKKSLEKLKKGQFLFQKEFRKYGNFQANQLLPCFYNKKVVALVRPLFGSKEIKKIKDYVIRPDRIL